MEFIKQKNQFFKDYDFEKPLTEWRPSMIDIELSELEFVMRSARRKRIKSQLENNCYKNKYIQDIYNKDMQIIDDNKPWYFITISPKEDIKLADFRTKIHNITKWKIFQKGYYVYEQRGDTPDTIGTGFHVHILLEKYNIEYKRLIRRLEDTFKNFCGKPYKNTINVVRKKPEHARETLSEYMKGNKQEDKQQKCDFDAIWRKKENIQDIYSWDCSDGQDNPKTVTDGRVNNGGKRAGAGRKKKEVTETITDDNWIEVNNNVTLEF